MKDTTKTVKVSEGVHRKLKLHATKNNVNITDFVDKAIVDKIKSDNLTVKILKSFHPSELSNKK